MKYSEKTRQATIRDWRKLGFYYELNELKRRWEFRGSREGLMKLGELLVTYAEEHDENSDSEHEHYGPYMYLKVMTRDEMAFTEQGIEGPVEKIGELGRAIVRHAAGLRPVATLMIDSPKEGGHALVLLVQADGFDPAAADEDLRE
jgi:hypothetical protein